MEQLAWLWKTVINISTELMLVYFFLGMFFGVFPNLSLNSQLFFYYYPSM